MNTWYLVFVKYYKGGQNKVGEGGGRNVRMGKMVMHIAFRLGNLKHSDRFENLGVDWIHRDQDGNSWSAVMKTVMKLLVP
jgi:hypothetical protein